MGIPLNIEDFVLPTTTATGRVIGVSSVIEGANVELVGDADRRAVIFFWV